MKYINKVRATLLLVLLWSVVSGCTSVCMPGDGGAKWFDSIELALGSSFNLWKIQNDAVPNFDIPLVYPKSWSADKWHQAYLEYAHRYQETRHINYLFELRYDEWNPRNDSRLDEASWKTRFSGHPDIHWLATAKSDLPVDGRVVGHYLPILRYRAPFKSYETYLVIFEMGDQIIGYVRWAYTRGEVKYIQKQFGFIP